MLRALLEEANYRIELDEVSPSVTLMSALCPDDMSVPVAIKTDFRIICATPSRKSITQQEASPPAENISEDSEPFHSSSLFVSYSHEDKKWFELVAKHLLPLTTSKNIRAWSDKEIKKGALWENEIQQAIETATVAVLLVSPNFLASKFIMNVELPLILKQAEANQLTIVWLAVSSTLYEETDLKRYQAANDPAVPLDMLPPPARNRELAKICRTIRQVASRAGKLGE